MRLNDCPSIENMKEMSKLISFLPKEIQEMDGIINVYGSLENCPEKSDPEVRYGSIQGNYFIGANIINIFLFNIKSHPLAHVFFHEVKHLIQDAEGYFSNMPECLEFDRPHDERKYEAEANIFASEMTKLNCL